MAVERSIVGRFAPTPSGRMHMGNVFAALMAWLAVRSAGGTMLLRMEDLDRQRTKPEYAQVLLEDLVWLGLDYDLQTEPQSRRTEVYIDYFEKLQSMGLLYPCYCTRDQLHSVNAPHRSDGTYVYPGTCRDLIETARNAFGKAPAWRVRVPDRTYMVCDRIQGVYQENLATDCGDFIVRRADGAFVYQLAVTVDDGLSGVTQVIRGVDLLNSSPRQMYLQELFGFRTPEYAHVPLLVAPDGRRLSKRDRDMDLGFLRSRVTAPQIVGQLAFASGLLEKPQSITPQELIREFTFDRLKKDDICLDLSPIL